LTPSQIFPALLLAALALSGCGQSSNPDPDVETGRRLFGEHCASCHSLSPDTVIVGPSLSGVASRVEDNPLGLQAAAYLRSSIVTPQADLVEGFADLMPVDFERKLTPEQLQALIDFLLTQR
jgi:mono/diheme cytochrome c family protein